MPPQPRRRSRRPAVLSSRCSVAPQPPQPQPRRSVLLVARVVQRRCLVGYAVKGLVGEGRGREGSAPQAPLVRPHGEIGEFGDPFL